MKAFHPLFLLTTLLLVVGLACRYVSGGDVPAQPEQPSAPIQEADTPTEAPAPAEEPVNEVYFTEEFDTSLSSDWDVLTIEAQDGANASKVLVETRDGKLAWDFDSLYLYYYLFYNAVEYTDVRLDVQAENRGRNNNSVSLICRYDPQVGWYEFNVTNGGLYNILYAEVSPKGNIGYTTLTNGGSNSIKQGKDVNEYAIVCKGNQLTLYINGDEVNSIAENKYDLREGQVGVSVSSFNVLPIQIEMDWFKVGEP